MPTRSISFFLLLFLLSFKLFGQSKNLEKMVSYIIHSEVDFEKTPGLLVGIIDPDSSYIFPYGVMEKGGKEPIPLDAIFEVGSITKVFTSSLLSLLVGEQQLSLDSPLSSFSLEGFQNPKWDGDDLTIKSLATHCSGLPKLPQNFGSKEKDASNPYAFYTRDDLFSFLNNYHPETEKPSYRYSHIGYALLGEIITQSTRTPYADLLNERLLEPIGLDDTRFSLSELQKERLCKGYSIIGQEKTPWDAQVFNSAVGLKSSMNDLLRFIALFLEDSPSELSESLLTTCAPQTTTSISKVSMGLGWHIFQPKKKFYDVVAHSGVTSGHRAYIGFVRETHTAVIILANSEAVMNAAGNIILQSINKNWRK